LYFIYLFIYFLLKTYLFLPKARRKLSEKARQADLGGFCEPKKSSAAEPLFTVMRDSEEGRLCFSSASGRDLCCSLHKSFSSII